MTPIAPVLILLLLAPAAYSTEVTSNQILTMEGLGSVHIGMTVPQAEEASGQKLKSMNAEDGISSESCWLTQRADGSEPWITYMVQNGRIVRIDIWQKDQMAWRREFSVPSVVTNRDIGIGSAEALVIEKYGSNLKIDPHPYMEDQGHYMALLSNDGRLGLLFETTDGKVVNFRAGTVDSIRLIEGCS